MFSTSLAGEAIGAALAQLAMLVVLAIVIVSVITAIVTGLRALHHWRKSVRRRQEADGQSDARRSILKDAWLLETPWPHPARKPERPPKYRIGL